MPRKPEKLSAVVKRLLLGTHHTVLQHRRDEGKFITTHCKTQNEWNGCETFFSRWEYMGGVGSESPEVIHYRLFQDDEIAYLIDCVTGYGVNLYHHRTDDATVAGAIGFLRGLRWIKTDKTYRFSIRCPRKSKKNTNRT